MAARLKVFVTSDGLTDYVVAATSKPKALAAWGSHQDLFKTGLAYETDDPELVKAATATPGEVLRRPAGTRAELANMKPVKRAKASTGKAAPEKPQSPSKAALKRVADLEKTLERIEAEHETAVRKIEARRAALARELEALEEQHAAARARYATALKAAREALDT
jgi:hypothetical protein